MGVPTKTFLLPCTGCPSEIEVVSGQAGGHVECPSCGKRNDVPKFRDLDQLRTKTVAAGGQVSRWGFPQAVILAGVACAITCWTVAAFVGATPKSAIDAGLTRANIEAGDDAALYRSLQDYAESTVDRMPMRVEVDLQRRTLFAQGMSRAMYAIGSLGAVAAAAAGIALLRTRRQP
jgi:DNA-directed RNA polymerase subunit RPC12/RpoP